MWALKKLEAYQHDANAMAPSLEDVLIAIGKLDQDWWVPGLGSAQLDVAHFPALGSAATSRGSQGMQDQ